MNVSASTVIVVGGGVAGLVCAIELHRAGRAVLLLEGATDIGGRVRSSVVNGITIDHGFQVLFTAYPTLTSYLDLGALALRRFEPAARIVQGGRVSRIGDALRDPSLLFDTIVAGAVPLGDKLRMLALRRFATNLAIDDCFHARFASQSTREFLAARGFSATVIDGFFAPFYGGILLDRTLSTSASVLLFTFKMLAEGDTAVPARGIGEIAVQLGAQLPPSAVRIGVPVTALHASGGRVTGVSLADGSAFDAHDIVLATDAPAAAALASTVGLSLDTPAGARGCTTVYFTTQSTGATNGATNGASNGASSPSLIPGRTLWLAGRDATPTSISHAITLSDVAPEYVPTDLRAAGVSLIAATAVGQAADMSDEAIERSARTDLAAMARAAGHSSADAAAAAMTRLATWRVPYAQFAQPPGWREQRPAISCGMPGLWRASEVLHSSSLEGAARGGRDAARAILQHPTT